MSMAISSTTGSARMMMPVRLWRLAHADHAHAEKVAEDGVVDELRLRPHDVDHREHDGQKPTQPHRHKGHDQSHDRAHRDAEQDRIDDMNANAAKHTQVQRQLDVNADAHQQDQIAKPIHPAGQSFMHERTLPIENMSILTNPMAECKQGQGKYTDY